MQQSQKTSDVAAEDVVNLLLAYLQVFFSRSELIFPSLAETVFFPHAEGWCEQ